MRNLVIDDQRLFVMYDPTYARTYEEGIVQIVSKDGWDKVYLDHDLGSESDETGYDIAQALEKDAYDGILYNIGEIVIVSSNPVGRMRIYHALHKFYNVRFWSGE